MWEKEGGGKKWRGIKRLLLLLLLWRERERERRTIRPLEGGEEGEEASSGLGNRQAKGEMK